MIQAGIERDSSADRDSLMDTVTCMYEVSLLPIFLWRGNRYQIIEGAKRIVYADIKGWIGMAWYNSILSQGLSLSLRCYISTIKNYMYLKYPRTHSLIRM